MAIHELKEQIGRLPEQPGVYLYFNEDGETIYVGKARALRDRVRNYLGAHGTDAKTDALLDEVVRLEVIVTDSVVEALALENNLIKQRTPKYNIMLRDDKNYPFLQLTTNEAFPRVLVARGVQRDGSFYAGPFMPAHFARKTMSLTHRLFGMRSCNEVITGKRERPCLEYDIKRCIAPCVDTICSEQDYGRAVQDARLFLEGKNDELVKTLRTRMVGAADGERYEEAAQLRDALRTVQTLHDRQQKMATAELGHRDVFGLKLGPAGVAIQVFQVRSGRVVERVELGTEEAIVGSSDGDVLEAAIQQFYELRAAPAEIYVPAEPADRDALEIWLSERVGRKVRIIVPQRGEKRGFVDLANRNAALAYQTRFNQSQTAQYDALETLQHILALPSLPRRIECFDISTIQGSETVASMVVCEDGRMRRSEYRKFRIRGSAQDDFAAMHEVVLRRYRKLLELGGLFPDLVLIDGGKGQLSAACDVMEGAGVHDIPVVGVAKGPHHGRDGREVFHLPGGREITLPPNAPLMFYLQRLRDEAHRFAIGTHRAKRAKSLTTSTLDEVPGIGPNRKRALLMHFGTARAVKGAALEDLERAPGISKAMARQLHDYFHSRG